MCCGACPLLPLLPPFPHDVPPPRAEIYSTGRSNLPGSVTERELLSSFSRMLPELLRFSSSSDLVSKFPEKLQRAHQVDDEQAAAVTPKMGRAAVQALVKRERLESGGRQPRALVRWAAEVLG